MKIIIVLLITTLIVFILDLLISLKKYLDVEMFGDLLYLGLLLKSVYGMLLNKNLGKFIQEELLFIIKNGLELNNGELLDLF